LKRQARAHRGLLVGLSVIALLALFPFSGAESWIVNIGIFTLMYAVLGSAWNLIGGYTGYVSLGSVAFFGLGAYGLALTFQHIGIGNGFLPFALVPLIGIAVAIISLPIGWIAFRTRGLPFIIVTISLVIILQYMALNLTDVTGGAPGLQVPQAPFPPGTYEEYFYWAMLVVFAVTLLACAYVRRSRLGLMMFAVREDEDKARGLGVATSVPKYAAFAGCAAFSAMAGAVWAYYLSTVYPQFAFDGEFLAMGIILVAYLGGIGTLWGPFVGALILTPAQQYFAYSLGGSQLYLIAYAAVFIVVMLFLPRGVMTTFADRALRRSRRRKQVVEELATAESESPRDAPSRVVAR
jgi:branched-chain amino acid transport system permease protein